MQPGMAAKIAAADVDPIALQEPPVLRSPRSRRTIVFCVVAAIAYLIGLIAFIPAAKFMEEGENLRVGGTIWNGEAVLASTIRVEWTFAPLTSLARFGYAADWHMSGGGTDLAGTMIQRGSVMRLENVSGQADATLLAALAPSLPLECNFVADVRLQWLQLGGAEQSGEGTLRMAPSRCSARGLPAPAVEVPALRGTIVPRNTGTIASLMTAAGQQHLVEMRLSRDGAFSLWPTPMAVQLAPVLAGKRYDTRIE